MTSSSRPQRRERSPRPTATFALPSHWSPKQALAVFECIEMMRDQLWLAYGCEIQRAWRDQYTSDRAIPIVDPDSPF